MTDLTNAILPDVRRFCSGVPDYVITAAIDNGCRRFFAESQSYTEQQTVTATASTVQVAPQAAETFITDVVRVTTRYGRPLMATYQSGNIALPGNPNGDIDITLALSPTAPTVPEWAYPLHKDAFIHAATTDLKSQQAQPWFDPDGASYHEREYRHWLGVARIAQTPTIVAPIPFA